MKNQTNQPLTQQGKEGEKVYRKVSVKDKLPNFYELAGERLFYIDFQDKLCVWKLGGLPPNRLDFKAIVKYWLEELQLSSLTAKEEANEEDLYKAIEKINEGNYGSAKNFIERYINSTMPREASDAIQKELKYGNPFEESDAIELDIKLLFSKKFNEWFKEFSNFTINDIIEKYKSENQ